MKENKNMITPQHSSSLKGNCYVFPANNFRQHANFVISTIQFMKCVALFVCPALVSLIVTNGWYHFLVFGKDTAYYCIQIPIEHSGVLFIWLMDRLWLWYVVIHVETVFYYKYHHRVTLYSGLCTQTSQQLSQELWPATMMSVAVLN